ncbi:HET-domain-containing protein [Hyaloscypha variabilis F]|uniref:HET-domain-containing protein n=1 Tax=Hyaloscypha variabilis (strain UAMH 11265 / GT02V1 / F) TaxID=1149755 RepID=A0A2J6QYV6_HYAVF|nr:HET-domain-containing protein [Hyaloscypha variabilis F]
MCTMQGFSIMWGAYTRQSKIAYSQLAHFSFRRAKRNFPRRIGLRVIQIPLFKLGDLEEGCSFCDLIKGVISIEFPGYSRSNFIVFNARHERQDGHICPGLYVAMATEEAVAAYPAPISSLANMKPNELDQYLIGRTRLDSSDPLINLLRTDDPRIIATTSRPLACLQRKRNIASQARRTVRILLARMKQWVASQAWLKNGRILLTCPDDKMRIDFSKLRSWISGCCNSWPCAGGHRSHILCNGPKSSMDFMTTRLIDCTKREIILNDQHMPYIALSYVWGKIVQGVERSVTGRPVIPAKIPQTIADAMVVVRSLGMKYLWVDRYCILEEDDKMLQIRNMNLIYGNALCTLVALEGVNADAGLPGVSNREFQVIQRGWTYQELFLSRRCILFNQSQALFVCKGDMPGRTLRYYKSEAGCSSRDNPPEITLFNTLGNDDTHNQAQMSQRFKKHLDGYSSRSLTNESDAMDAFKGILSLISSFYFWGTPILPGSCSIGKYTERALKSTMNVGFVAGLTWKRHGTLEVSKVPKRRAGFPSWCWASVPAQTGFSDPVFQALWSEGKFYEGNLQSLQVKAPDGEKTTLLGLHAWWIEESPRRNLDVNPTIELKVDMAQIK